MDGMVSMSNYYFKNKEKWKVYGETFRKKHPDKVKSKNDRQSPLRISFRGRRILLKSNPRTGVCSNCKSSVAKGEIKQTNIHHTKYHYDDPLKDTIELCVKCHNIETKKEIAAKILEEYVRKIEDVTIP